jgi:hypothetical protein
MFAAESSIPKMNPNLMNQAIDMIPLTFILEAMLKNHSQEDISEYKVLALTIETVFEQSCAPTHFLIGIEKLCCCTVKLYYLSIDVFFQLTLP